MKLKLNNIEPFNEQIYNEVHSTNLFSVESSSTSVPIIALTSNITVSEGNYDIKRAIHVTYPISMRGSIKSVLNNSTYQPSCKLVIRNAFIFQASESHGTSEVEDIHFESQTHSGYLCCGDGNVIFRRCRFSSGDVGICCAEGIGKIVFENCLFEQCVGSGALLEAGVRASFYHCTFRNNGKGIEVRQGGITEIYNCYFANNSRQAVVCYCRGESALIDNCLMESSGDSAVLVSEFTHTSIQNSTIHKAKAGGITVQNKGCVTVQSCAVSECIHGVLFQAGRCKGTVSDCHISSNTAFGMFIAEDCTGKIELNNNNITQNCHGEINNDGGNLCTVYLNDIVYPNNGIVSKLNKATKQQIQAKSNEALKQNNPNYNYLPEQRYRKKAGLDIDTVHCHNCDLEEPKDIKFQICSKCLSVVYCCRDCQVADWKKHKPECISRAKYPTQADEEVDVRGSRK